MSFPIKISGLFDKFNQSTKLEPLRIVSVSVEEVSYSNSHRMIDNSSDVCTKILSDYQSFTEKARKTAEEKDGDNRKQFKVQFNDNIDTSFYELSKSEKDEKTARLKEINRRHELYSYETYDLIVDLNNSLKRGRWFAETT